MPFHLQDHQQSFGGGWFQLFQEGAGQEVLAEC